MTAAQAGANEAAVRAFVADLGELDPRRSVQAAVAVRLARLLDVEEGSAAAAVSRELRLAVASLEARVPIASAPAAGPAAEVRVDAVTAARDDLARKRRQRAGAG